MVELFDVECHRNRMIVLNLVVSSRLAVVRRKRSGRCNGIQYQPTYDEDLMTETDDLGV
jgi:hypothetical protein